MVRSLNTPEGGLVFFQSLNRRQRLARRRFYVVSTIAGLAAASAAIGAFTAPRIDGAGGPSSGPFSYFPSE